MPTIRIVALLACTALLLPATAAEAKAPPKGKYDCVIGANSVLFGTLTIKRKGRYSHRGRSGRFRHGKKVTFPDRVVGFKLSFRGGGLRGIKGRWYKGLDGTPAGSYEIALKNPRDGFESIYCTKRK